MWTKFKRKVYGVFLNKIGNTFLQFKIYPSYWHYYFNRKKKPSSALGGERYLCLQPNYGAGIGHQLANWNSGLYFAGFFDLIFAHSAFSNEKWESFLGLGEGEVQVSDLLNNAAYKKVQIPRFDSNNQEEIKLVRNIISSYDREKVLFILERDQGYMAQYETYKLLSEKFFSASARAGEKLLFNGNDFNIAIHIRRGDIVDMKMGAVSNWEQRWLDNLYYVNVLKKVLQTIDISKKINIYLFSQGKQEDFTEFKEFENVVYCTEMDPYNSFLNMVYADLLISSKSSFSYKPALISRGVKICPGAFWHGYPKTKDYILANNEGDFDESKLLVALKSD